MREERNDRPAGREDWGIKPMPRRHRSFFLKCRFSTEQMEILRRGHIPGEMEDKWFWFMEGDTLYAHRSWTGLCNYIVEFRPDGRQKVTVNRSRHEYSGGRMAEERERITGLLESWASPFYDPYRQWISEAVEALDKAKGRGDRG